MTHDPRIRHVIALIVRRRDTPPSLAELSRAANLSQAQLTRLFRRETGAPPAAFGRALRLDHARSLLQSSFLTVKQVMAASGWSDPSHFSREFRRRHGKSPLAFRRHAAEFTDENGDVPSRSGDHPDERADRPREAFIGQLLSGMTTGDGAYSEGSPCHKRDDAKPPAGPDEEDVSSEPR